MMNELEKIDRALDEALVHLGAMVLKLADPRMTRSTAERRALAQSVTQYSVCANRSHDPRVRRLKSELEATIRPHLQLVSSR
jgi:hypothetical protein